MRVTPVGASGLKNETPLVQDESERHFHVHSTVEWLTMTLVEPLCLLREPPRLQGEPSCV